MTMPLFEQSAATVRAGRRATDPQIVTTRMPPWAMLLVVGLVVANVAMAATLVRARPNPAEEPGAAYANLKSLEQKLEKSPNDPKILLQLGFEYRKAGMLGDALRVNRSLAEMDPNDVASRYNIGSVLLAMGDDKEAESALWDVLEIEPTHAMAAKSLGELYAKWGHYRSLLVAVEPAAVEHPELADLQYLWGLGKEKTGDLPGARRAYWLAMQRDSNLVAARAGYKRLGGE